MGATKQPNKRKGLRSFASKVHWFKSVKESILDKTLNQNKHEDVSDNNSLLIVSLRSMLGNNEFSKLDYLELKVIKILYNELSARSDTEGIDKNIFRDYFNIPCLWGERLFAFFDKEKNGYVNFVDFVKGLSFCCKGTKKQKMEALYFIFDLNNDNVIDASELALLLSNVPNLTLYLKDFKNAQAIASNEENNFLNCPNAVQIHSIDAVHDKNNNIKVVDESRGKQTSNRNNINNLIDNTNNDDCNNKVFKRIYSSSNLDIKDSTSTKNTSVDFTNNNNSIAFPNDLHDSNGLVIDQMTGKVTSIPANTSSSTDDEQEVYDLDLIVNEILNKYDATNNNYLRFEDFTYFIDHNEDLLKLFVDGLIENVWSLSGLAFNRDKQKDQEYMNKWTVIQQFFRQYQNIDCISQGNLFNANECNLDVVKTNDSFNNSHNAHGSPNSLQTNSNNETKIQVCDGDASNVDNKTSLYHYQNNQILEDANNVEEFLCEYGSNISKDELNSVAQKTANCSWDNILQCPCCMSSLICCPKCDKRQIKLVFEEDEIVTIDCCNCINNEYTKFYECWMCNWKFNDVLKLDRQNKICLDNTVFLLDAKKFISIRCLCVDYLLFYYTDNNNNVPLGFIYLDNCYVEKILIQTTDNNFKIVKYDENINENNDDISLGIKIGYRNSSNDDNDRIIKFEQVSTWNLWFETLQELLAQQPIASLYDIHEVIGNGRFSTVYRAFERKTNKEYAIKIINKSKINDSNYNLVRTELNILRLISHPNLVSLKNFITSKDNLHIVMEYVRGGHLFDAIIKNGPFEEQIIYRYTLQMLKTLNHLHKCGIAHRDIKPENILLTSFDIETADIKLADFGLACFCGPNETIAQPCGTLAYAAPEILTLEGYTCKVDIWALGVVVYLMACGKLPFPIIKGYGKAAIRDKNNFYKLKFLEPEWEKINSTCKNFIKQLLIINPNARFSATDALNHIWIKHHNAITYE